MIEIGPNLTRILGWLIALAMVAVLYQAGALGIVLVACAFVIFWVVNG